MFLWQLSADLVSVKSYVFQAFYIKHSVIQAGLNMLPINIITCVSEFTHRDFHQYISKDFLQMWGEKEDTVLKRIAWEQASVRARIRIPDSWEVFYPLDKALC